jgi:hypothetical protein
MDRLGLLLSSCEIYCRARIAPVHLEATEELILNDFDEYLLAPTAIEYARLLFFIGNNSLDFTMVSVKVADNIIICCSQEQMCRYTQSSIGLACVMQALEQLNYIKFASGLMEKIYEDRLAFDIRSASECQLRLSQYLRLITDIPQETDI